MARRVVATPLLTDSPVVSRSISNTPLASSHSGGDLGPVHRSPIPVAVSPLPAVEAIPPIASMVAGAADEASPAKTIRSIKPTIPAARDRVLFTRKSPVLGVETSGPQRIIVGKESVYEITLHNTGPVAAEQTVVTIDLPVWADVRGAEASTGSTSSAAVIEGTRQFRWHLGRLDARREERLVLRIVPLESRPFDLAVNWDYTPSASKAMIEVEEPKLELGLQGPREVLYGQKEVYRLEIANTGTGQATDVKIVLQPLGAGDNMPASQAIGTIQAGTTKVIDVELTARQVGELLIKIDATGDGVEAHLSEQVAVLRSALKVDIEMPPKQFVGSQSTYQIHVSNPGTAPARNVIVTATIPSGTQYVSCRQNGLAGPTQRSVTWTRKTLPPGEEVSFAVTCQMEEAGPKRLEVVSTAGKDVTASGTGTVRGEAMADLKLSVGDPTGPVRVGADAHYQLEVENRGSKSAEDVEIVAYFSNGVEPLVVEGGQYRIGPGQVVFENIASLAAGKKVTFQITARADISGSHVFRVEVHCKPIGTRLVSEETTHFYGDAQVSQYQPARPSKSSPLRGQELRTAVRPQPPATVSPVTGRANPTPATTRR